MVMSRATSTKNIVSADGTLNSQGFVIIASNSMKIFKLSYIFENVSVDESQFISAQCTSSRGMELTSTGSVNMQTYSDRSAVIHFGRWITSGYC
jgi:hypothetical protein